MGQSVTYESVKLIIRFQLWRGFCNFYLLNFLKTYFCHIIHINKFKKAKLVNVFCYNILLSTIISNVSYQLLSLTFITKQIINVLRKMRNCDLKMYGQVLKACRFSLIMKGRKKICRKKNQPILFIIHILLKKQIISGLYFSISILLFK